jgi:hypothetical protein
MSHNNLLAIRINDREDTSLKIQQVLTTHGCKIKTRLGLHDDGDGVCSQAGTMILQLHCSVDEGKTVADDLLKIDGVKAQFINFD